MADPPDSSPADKDLEEGGRFTSSVRGSGLNANFDGSNG
jgi:hypothetical protein